MPDSDKFSTLIELGILVGGGILGALGIRRAKRSPDDQDSDRDRDRERLRIDRDRDRERLRVLEAERVEGLTKAMEDRIVAKIEITDMHQSAARELGLKTNRSMFFEEFEKYHNQSSEQKAQMMEKIEDIDRCVRRLENEFAEHRSDVEALKRAETETRPRRPR